MALLILIGRINCLLTKNYLLLLRDAFTCSTICNSMGSSCSNFVDSPSKEPKCQFVEKTEKPYGLVRASKFSNKSVKVWTKEPITTGNMIIQFSFLHHFFLYLGNYVYFFVPPFFVSVYLIFMKIYPYSASFYNFGYQRQSWRLFGWPRKFTPNHFLCWLSCNRRRLLWCFRFYNYEVGYEIQGKYFTKKYIS